MEYDCPTIVLDIFVSNRQTLKETNLSNLLLDTVNVHNKGEGEKSNCKLFRFKSFILKTNYVCRFLIQKLKFVNCYSKQLTLEHQYNLLVLVHTNLHFYDHHC